MILILAIIIGAVALDQLTKWLTVIYLDYRESFPLWQDVLHFTHERNEGAAFSMLSDHRWVFMTFSTVAIIGLIIYLFFFPPKSKFVKVTLAMIVGGGIGNMGYLLWDMVRESKASKQAKTATANRTEPSLKTESGNDGSTLE